jgi:hypothetical protein
LLIDGKGEMLFNLLETYVASKLLFLNAADEEKRRQREQRYVGAKQTIEGLTNVHTLSAAMDALEQLIEKAMAAPGHSMSEVVRKTSKRLHSGTDSDTNAQ